MRLVMEAAANGKQPPNLTSEEEDTIAMMMNVYNLIKHRREKGLPTPSEPRNVNKLFPNAVSRSRSRDSSREPSPEPSQQRKQNLNLKGLVGFEVAAAWSVLMLCKQTKRQSTGTTNVKVRRRSEAGHRGDTSHLHRRKPQEMKFGSHLSPAGQRPRRSSIAGEGHRRSTNRT